VPGGGTPRTPALAKSDVRKVQRDIARLTKALDRTVRPSRIGTLAEDVQATVVSNVEADKATLAGLGEAAAAADTTLDLRQVRRDLRKVRVENYRLSVNVLRQAARVDAAANPEAAALVASAVAKALTVTAASPKSLVREARADLAAARDLLDVETEGKTEPTEPVTA
jgi:hypothetical protein